LVVLPFSVYFGFLPAIAFSDGGSKFVLRILRIQKIKEYADFPNYA